MKTCRAAGESDAVSLGWTPIVNERMCAAAILAAVLIFHPRVAESHDDSRLTPASATAHRDSATLAVWDGSRWRTWWSSSAAPDRWRSSHPVVARAIEWKRAHPGFDVGTVRFSGALEAWRFNVVVLRIDPQHVEFGLHVQRGPDGRALPWSIKELPPDAVLAVNAGMFDALGPWGWIVLDGQERQAPGRGPLSSALTVDAAGIARLITADSIAAARARDDVQWAVQSYPTALYGDGDVPIQLRSDGRGVNLEHRDARLAVATLRDGRVLIAITRFDGLGGALDVVPFGPTLPEMTAILGALGAQRAMFLDGGVSAQMAVRDARGGVERWNGLRRVPLALVGRSRPPTSVNGER